MFILAHYFEIGQKLNMKPIDELTFILVGQVAFFLPVRVCIKPFALDIKSLVSS